MWHLAESVSRFPLLDQSDLRRASSGFHIMRATEEYAAGRIEGDADARSELVV